MADEVRPDDLPDGWIVVNEVNEDGVMEYSFLCIGSVPPELYYTNTETRQTFYTKADLFHYVAYARQANLPQVVVPDQPDQERCARCKCTEHITSECNFPEKLLRGIKSLYEPPPFKRGESDEKTMYKCSRCGRYGHNIRTCHGPLVKF